MFVINKIGQLSFLLLLIIIYYGCSDLKSNENLLIFPKTQKFVEYWYLGKAELNRYDLQQVRYGEIHKGNAVLIFVKEDFLKDEQVKYEYSQPNSNVQSILKLNFNRKFYTGLYPYSMMTSTFFPIQSYENHATKISSTTQEWCGHTYMQLNNRNNKFSIQHNSYFQKEGDKQFEIEQALLEDEIWTLIRINPELLPIGEIEVIPGMQYVRLLHTEYKCEQAVAEKREVSDPDLSPNSLIQYSIKYREFSRTLKITFEKEFPYHILAWDESYKPLSVKSNKSEIMITKARRTNTMMLDYWKKNSVADSIYRKHLGIKN
jgi:hypothetical protein